MSDDTGYEVTNSMGRYGCIPDWVLPALIDRHARSKGVSPHISLALYVTMSARWADRDDSTLFPARPTMAKALGVSLDTIDRCVAALVDVGALLVTPRFDEHGDATSNLYQLLVMPPPGGGSRSPAATPHAGTSRENPSKGGSRSPAATGSRSPAALTNISRNEDTSCAPAAQNEDTGADTGFEQTTWDPIERRHVTIRDGEVIPVTPQRELWEAIRVALGYDRPTTTQRTDIGKTATELRTAGATVESFERFVADWRREWPTMTITASGIRKHYGRMWNGTGDRNDPDDVPAWKPGWVGKHGIAYDVKPAYVGDDPRYDRDEIYRGLLGQGFTPDQAAEECSLMFDPPS